MNLLRKIFRRGFFWFFSRVIYKLQLKTGYLQWKFRHAPIYIDPTREELKAIERDLVAKNIVVVDFHPDPNAFEAFLDSEWFPPGYHGGVASGVWREKQLEHWLAAEILNLEDLNNGEIYVDIAAASSPWARELRDRLSIKAFAIDLSAPPPELSAFDYYRQENAAESSFEDTSVSAVSLQCAFEMFAGDDDINFIRELARILKPGGRAVILPLYLHTTYRYYATPDFYNVGHPLQPTDAEKFIRLDCEGIMASRKYDAPELIRRVIDTIRASGLDYKLSVLRNKEAFGDTIYCHFILEIYK